MTEDATNEAITNGATTNGAATPEDAASYYRYRFLGGSGRVAVLLLHGTGGDEEDLIPLGRQIAPGAPLLSPRGDVSEGGALRFFRRQAPGVFDPQELLESARKLSGFIATATEQYGLDAERLVAVGLSNGANIALNTLLLYPDAIAGAVLLRPMLTLEPDALPTRPDLTGKAVLVASGDADPMVPQENIARLVAFLGEAGAEVTHAPQPTGHGLVPADLAGATAWFAARYGNDA